MAQPLTVIIFGASGDLTGRKIIPALFNLATKKHLPPEAKILGVARSPLTDDTFRTQLADKAKEAFKSSGEEWKESEWAEFAKRLHYVSADVTKPGGIDPVKGWFDA